jgi:hypothetical protein
LMVTSYSSPSQPDLGSTTTAVLGPPALSPLSPPVTTAWGGSGAAGAGAGSGEVGDSGSGVGGMGDGAAMVPTGRPWATASVNPDPPVADTRVATETARARRAAPAPVGRGGRSGATATASPNAAVPGDTLRCGSTVSASQGRRLANATAASTTTKPSSEKTARPGNPPSPTGVREAIARR